MMFYKTIVCLANSRKNGGRCVAGKEIINGQLTPHWIRPVSRSGTGELSSRQSRLRDRIPFPKLPNWLNNWLGLFIKRYSSAQMLDLITIPLLEHQSHAYQSENYLIDNDQCWIKEPATIPIQLSQCCDATESLWINGYHSYSGSNDKIPLAIAETQVKTSLLLIKPSTINIIVASEFNHRLKVRTEFTYRGQHYRLVVTDPQFEYRYKFKPTGNYPLGKEVYLCISLGEPFQNYCYKLVTAIFEEN